MPIEHDLFRSPYERMVINLLYTSNWMNEEQTRLLKSYGFTPEQYNVLRILRGHYPNPVKVMDIIERMLDKMSNASRLVDKLFTKKLVQRTECSHDRRAVDVLITEAGLSLLAIIDARQQAWEDTLQTLTETEANQLCHLLDKLRDNFC